ncbi:MAG: hypothetical protein EKK41_11100 [Hyphomicrobiales bacterium]|nr:MAG: hypothetical protein EKK41_11100 [Hyphomicrobiales bacterium]
MGCSSCRRPLVIGTTT